MSYADEFIFLSNYLTYNDVEGAARAALSRKYAVWSHEQEVRVIGEDPFHLLSEPISRIIVGPRMNQPMVSVLYLVCSHYGIPLERAVIADWGIYSSGVQQPWALEPKSHP